MKLIPDFEMSLDSLAKVVKACDVDKKQLAIGIAVELEHTKDPKEAEKIAKDHLTEDPQYYTKPMKKDWGAEEAKNRIEELGKKASSESIKTWQQIRNEQDPDGTKHDLRLHCIRCGNTSTCRCSKPKRKFDGLCEKCAPVEKFEFDLKKALKQSSTMFQLIKDAESSKQDGVIFQAANQLEPDVLPTKTSAVFVLEDDPERIKIFKEAFGQGNVVVTNSVKEALNNLRNQRFAHVFLDRDLSRPNETGEDVAWEMERERLCPTTPVTIHSENTRGQKVMARYLGKYHPNVSVIPFRDLKKKILAMGV